MIISRTKFILAIALLVPFTAAVWLILEPTFMSASTYAMFSAVVIATGAIAINSWKNEQATTSTRQVIHEAEVGPASR